MTIDLDRLESVARAAKEVGQREYILGEPVPVLTTEWMTFRQDCDPSIVLDLIAAAKAAREALREIHEFNCGCEQPGRIAYCMAEPVREFELLARLNAKERDGAA
jgi:hypothetical protein